MATRRTRKVWTCGTDLFLPLVASSAGAGKPLKLRQRALHFLHAFFRKTVNVQRVSLCLVESCQRNASACDAGVVDGVCVHLRQATGEVHGDADGHLKAASACCALLRVANSCAACRGACADIVQTIAEHIDDNIFNGLVATETDVLKGPSPGGIVGGRKRRFSEAMRSKLVDKQLNKSKLHTVIDIAQDAGVSRQVRSQWTRNFCKSYHSAHFRLFSEHTGTFSVCEDGATLGHPGSDWLLFALRVPALRMSTSLMPQVCDATVWRTN